MEDLILRNNIMDDIARQQQELKQLLMELKAYKDGNVDFGKNEVTYLEKKGYPTDKINKETYCAERYYSLKKDVCSVLKCPVAFELDIDWMLRDLSHC